MSGTFWLYRWIDEFEVNGGVDSFALLKRDISVRKRLQAIAANDSYEPPAVYDGIDNALVLGRDIDLSGHLDCCLDTSKVRQIDQNFGPLMHYFDKLILAGPSPSHFAALLDEPDDRVIAGIATYIDGLAYLRDIGASEHIEFRPKFAVDVREYKRLARQFDIVNVLDLADDIVDRLTREGKVINQRQAPGHWHFAFRHSLFDHDIRGTVWSKKEPTKKEMAGAVFSQYATFITSDVISARMMKLPLGSNADLHASVLSGFQPGSAVDAAALNLYLPVLDGLPLRDIIKLRRDEYNYFVKFQAAIRSGIKRELETSGSDPEAAAREVQKEIIDPALADVYQQLRNAEKSLSKKAGLGLGVGTVLTIIGVLDTIPLVIGSGLAVAATAVAAAQNYFDAKKDIKNSDMYFLWLLEREAQRHVQRTH